MKMRFACLLAATPVSAFVSPQRKGAVQLWVANSGNSDDGGPVNVFDMVDDYWHKIRRDKKQNGNDVSNLFGGVLPDAKLPSMPNLIGGFLKKQKGISSSKIEGVEDFDLDLANEIEAALAMAENDIAGGSVNEFDSREQQQQQQHQQPSPLNQEYFTRTGQQVEAATAAATKAWLDNMTSNDTTTSKQEQYGYPQEEVREQNQRPFFANDAVQYTEAATYSNTNDYVGDSPFHRKSEENWSTNDGNSKDQFSAAVQTLADQSIRAGLEKKSVEETYKMYKQYFEQGVQTTFDDGMNSVEAQPPLENNDGDDTKVLISDAAFDLAESLRLDPYEIYQHKQNNFDGSNNMIDERDVLNYLDLRYEALLSKNNLPKPRKESRQRKAQVDNSVYEERDKARRQRTRANKSADYGGPRNDSEAEDNWQSYYDSYKQMAEVPTNVGGSSATDRQKHTQKRPQMPPIQRRPEQRYIPDHMSPKSYRPQQPRESHLSKLVYETKTEKLNGPPVNPRQSRMQSQREPRPPYKQTDRVRNSGPRHSRMQPKEEPVPYYEQVMNQAQNSPPNGYVNNRRDQNAHSKPSRGLGTNKNYPQDRSYRETRHKNSIDMNLSGYEDDMSYEEYNAYFAHNRGTPPMPSQSGSNLKGLLENRINQNLHKQELYDLEQQRYLDERLQRDMDRVSRLTQVQDQQRELENRFRHRELQHHQQELDDRLEQKMQRLSETTQKVTRDAKRAIENAQKGWFADGNQN